MSHIIVSSLLCTWYTPYLLLYLIRALPSDASMVGACSVVSEHLVVLLLTATWIDIVPLLPTRVEPFHIGMLPDFLKTVGLV